MALITSAEVKTYLEITSDKHNALITFLIPKAQALIETILNNKLDQTTYYQLYDGQGDDCIVLDKKPVVSITVLSNSVDLANSEYEDPIASTEFIIDKEAGIIEYIGARFAKGSRNVYAAYIAGYSDYPEDLKLIALEVIAKKFYDIEEKRFGITAKTVMNENISFSYQDLKSEHKKILQIHRKMAGSDGVNISALSLGS